MKINLDYGREPEKVADLSDSGLTADYILYAVQHTYGNLEGSKRRIYGRIQRKLKAAISSNLQDIELEEAEKDFIKRAFVEELKVPAEIALYFVVLEQEIAQL